MASPSAPSSPTASVFSDVETNYSTPPSSIGSPVMKSTEAAVHNNTKIKPEKTKPIITINYRHVKNAAIVWAILSSLDKWLPYILLAVFGTLWWLVCSATRSKFRLDDSYTFRFGDYPGDVVHEKVEHTPPIRNETIERSGRTNQNSKATIHINTTIETARSAQELKAETRKPTATEPKIERKTQPAGKTHATETEHIDRAEHPFPERKTAAELTHEAQLDMHPPKLPPPAPDSPASHPSYDNITAFQYHLRTRNLSLCGHPDIPYLYICLNIAGVWVLHDTQKYYIIQWLPQNQIWYCADYGWGITWEDDGSFQIMEGDPDTDDHMTAPPIWNGKDDMGPWFAEAWAEAAEVSGYRAELEAEARRRAGEEARKKAEDEMRRRAKEKRRQVEPQFGHIGKEREQNRHQQHTKQNGAHGYSYQQHADLQHFTPAADWAGQDDIYTRSMLDEVDRLVGDF